MYLNHINDTRHHFVTAYGACVMLRALKLVSISFYYVVMLETKKDIWILIIFSLWLLLSCKLIFIHMFFLLQLVVTDKTQNLRRLEAQRNELNAKGN